MYFGAGCCNSTVQDAWAINQSNVHLARNQLATTKNALLYLLLLSQYAAFTADIGQLAIFTFLITAPQRVTTELVICE